MLYSKLIGQRKMRMYWRGKMGFCPCFVKILKQCLCFETIKYRIYILKFDLKKIKLQVKLNINKVELYAYFVT